MAEKQVLLDDTKKLQNMGAITTDSDDHDHTQHMQHHLQLYDTDVDAISATTTITDYLHVLYASIFFAMAIFFQQSVSPITDVLQRDLGVSVSDIGALSSAYYVSYLAAQIPFGIMLQKYSHHTILCVVSIVLTVCFTVFGSIESLMAGMLLRIIAGIFGAPTWLLVVSVIARHFDNNTVQFYGAITTVISFMVTFVALTMQAFIYEKYGVWRDTYFILGLIGGVNVVAILATIFIHQRNSASELSHSNLINHNHNNNVAVPGVADDSFMQEQGHRIGYAMCNYFNWFLGMFGFAQYSIFSAIYGLWFVPFLMIRFDFTRSKASFASGIGLASSGIGTLLFGFLAAKHKKRKIYLCVATALMATLFFVLYLPPLNSAYTDACIFVVVIASGLGIGSVNILFTLVREYNAAMQCQETATSLVNCLMVSAGFISQYAIGVLLEYHHRDIERTNVPYDAGDFQFALSCVVIPCFAIAVVACIFVTETNGKNL